MTKREHLGLYREGDTVALTGKVIFSELERGTGISIHVDGGSGSVYVDRSEVVLTQQHIRVGDLVTAGDPCVLEVLSIHDGSAWVKGYGESPRTASIKDLKVSKRVETIERERREAEAAEREAKAAEPEMPLAEPPAEDYHRKPDPPLFSDEDESTKPHRRRVDRG